MTMKKKRITDGNKLLRQGDVLLRRLDDAKVPAGAKEEDREGGAIVLAHGEVTGHSHAIRVPRTHAKLYRSANAERFLRVLRRDVQLLHEEHAPVPLPPGLYEVVRQREYSGEEVRRVAD